MEKNAYNLLVDDILFRKAKIEVRKKDYSKAAEYLEKICADFSFESLGDDALFQLAELYNFQLNQQEKAKTTYKDVFINYPGSVFAEEARTKYRELLKIYPDKEEQEVEPEEKITD
ncbi:MAG: hypothetical protein CR987_00820 [Draconibacterium sp.]|nr:MAG: hypothetical protein CR987_00820 [Draconibacterium sp.]